MFHPRSSWERSGAAALLHAGATTIALPMFIRVGIELRRASCRWRVTGLALSICEAGSHFHHGHVSGGPPIIPDGRISHGPVGNLGLSSMRLPIGGEVQALVRIRPVFRGLPTASFHHMRRFITSSVSGPTLPMKPPSVQSPFAPCRCYRYLGETCTAS